MQVAGELGGQQRQVRLHERLSATLTADTGIGARCVQANLRSAGQHHPVSAETVRVRQPSRYGRRTGEAAGRRVERFVIVAEPATARFRPLTVSIEVPVDSISTPKPRPLTRPWPGDPRAAWRAGPRRATRPFAARPRGVPATPEGRRYAAPASTNQARATPRAGTSSRHDDSARPEQHPRGALPERPQHRGTPLAARPPGHTATPSSRRERDTARQATPGSPALLSVSPTRRARQTLRAY